MIKIDDRELYQHLMEIRAMQERILELLEEEVEEEEAEELKEHERKKSKLPKFTDKKEWLKLKSDKILEKIIDTDKPRENWRRNVDIIINLILIGLMVFFFAVYGLGIGQPKFDIEIIVDCNGYMKNWTTNYNENLTLNFSEVQKVIDKNMEQFRHETNQTIN